MGFDGVWKVEMLGPYGWENVSTAVLEKGRFFGASTDHHSIGRYEVDGDTIKVLTKITQHGRSRTIFGREQRVIEVCLEGAADSAGTIVGRAYPSSDDDVDVKLRLTRLGDLD